MCVFALCVFIANTQTTFRSAAKMKAQLPMEYNSNSYNTLNINSDSEQIIYNDAEPNQTEFKIEAYRDDSDTYTTLL